MEPTGTIVFASIGVTNFGFDVFSVAVPAPAPASAEAEAGVSADELDERRHTDGVSINFNAQFADDAGDTVAFVSERTGAAGLFLSRPGSESERPEPLPAAEGSLFHDRPTVRDGRVYFVSAHEQPDRPFQSWAGVYAAHVGKDGKPERLTPRGVVDISPAVSASGDLLAVASYGDRPWAFDFRVLETEVAVFRAADPSSRSVVAARGGWPVWHGDGALFFHRVADDGWWSVFHVGVSPDKLEPTGPERRVTPPGLHCFTPAAPGGPGAAPRRAVRPRDGALLAAHGGAQPGHPPLQPVLLAVGGPRRVPPVPRQGGSRRRAGAAPAAGALSRAVPPDAPRERHVPVLLARRGAHRRERRLLHDAGRQGAPLRRVQAVDGEQGAQPVPHLLEPDGARGGVHVHGPHLRDPQDDGPDRPRRVRPGRPHGRRRPRGGHRRDGEAADPAGVRQRRVPGGVTVRAVAGVPVGPDGAQEPVRGRHGARRGGRRPSPAADGGRVDRHDAELVAGREADRVLVEPARRGEPGSVQHLPGAARRHRPPPRVRGRAGGQCGGGQGADQPRVLQPGLAVAAVHGQPRQRRGGAHLGAQPVPAVRGPVRMPPRRLRPAAPHLQRLREWHAGVGARQHRARAGVASVGTSRRGGRVGPVRRAAVAYLPSLNL